MQTITKIVDFYKNHVLEFGMIGLIIGMIAFPFVFVKLTSCS